MAIDRRSPRSFTAFFCLLAAVPVAGTGCGSPDASSPVERAASGDEARIAPAYARESVRHSFRSKLGDDVDCVDFAAEPGVRMLVAQGASLDDIRRGLVVAAAQSGSPAASAGVISDAHYDGSLDERGAARACPEGTVPHVRGDAERLMAAAAAGRTGRAAIRPPLVPADGGLLSEFDTPGQEYAWVYAGYNDAVQIPGFAAQGGTTITTIAGPSVPPTSADHSVSQVWVWSGAWGGEIRQTVEVGWEVNAGFTTNSTPLLFIAATAQDYNDFCEDNYGTGCVGWVPNPGATIAPGAALTPSVIGGTQHELTITVKHQSCTGVPGCTGTWLGWGIWVAVDASPATYLGYYMNSSYLSWDPYGMGVAAQDFKVGGEICDTTGNITYPQHVPMGMQAITLGQAAYGYNAYHRNFGYYDANMSFVQAGATAFRTSPDYVYNITSPPGSASWTDYFYFGDLGCITQQVCMKNGQPIYPTVNSPPNWCTAAGGHYVTKQSC